LRREYRNDCLSDSLAVPKALVEPIHTPRGIHNFLLTGVEWMAPGANFQMDVLAQSGVSLDLVATAATRRNLFVFWMNPRFHGEPPEKSGGSYQRMNQSQAVSGYNIE